jgi:UTP--glucose-1-phosphate uridylyltransferase
MHKIRKCLFPAAGYGTRFLPVTKSMPKEMLPLVNKPLIQYGVEEAIEAGMNGMAIVTGRGKRALEDHFDISYELEHQIAGTDKEWLLTDIRRIIDQCTFSYTRQVEMKGLGHAILSGETLIGEEPFAVVLADDYCATEHGEEGVLSQMVKLYEKYRCSIVAIEEIPREDTRKYGVIAGDLEAEGLYRVREMVEKTRSCRGAEQPRHHRPLHPYAGHLRHPARDPPGAGRRDSDYRCPDDAGENG